jgi:hypothetical protein
MAEAARKETSGRALAFLQAPVVLGLAPMVPLPQ